MTDIKIPDWLKKILDDSGLDQGIYSFGEGLVELAGLPEEFVGIAECEGGGLALAKKGDGVVYRLAGGKIQVYAVDEKEFKLAMRRDEAWEELSENMPATRPFWLGIVLKTKNEAGEEMTLGFKGESRDSIMVVQGEMKQDEMLEDALNRELKSALMITQYQILDVVDEGGDFESQGELVPMFTVMVGVEGFDPQVIGDPQIGWINLSKKEMVN